MLGNFSLASLQTLLEQDIEVCAVVLPANPMPGMKSPPIQQRFQPILTRRTLTVHAGVSSHVSIAHLAWSRDIPVWEVARLADPLTHATLAQYQADMLCVSCFSLRIPQSILALSRLGSLNVHPSLLPKNRGPVPLFWTFRNGESITGVTIHLLDAGMDSGDILAQQPIPVPDGTTYAQLDAQCAQLGGKLLAETVWQLYQGQATPRAQDEKQSSYYSFPTADDFVIHAEEYDARYLYNFICGVGHWSQPIAIHTEHKVLYVRDCISYSRKGTPDVEDDGNYESYKTIECKDGTTIIVVPF